MAKRGDRLEMPDGSVYEVTRAAADTGGEFVEMQFTLPPGSVSPPPHVDKGLTEEYEVLEGKFEVMTVEPWRTISVGESASVQSGAVYSFMNRLGARLHVMFAEGLRARE